MKPCMRERCSQTSTLTLLRAVVELGGFPSRYDQREREKCSASTVYSAVEMVIPFPLLLAEVRWKSIGGSR